METMRRFFGKGLQFTSCERVAETYKMERTKIYCQKTGLTPYCMWSFLMKKIFLDFLFRLTSKTPKQYSALKQEEKSAPVRVDLPVAIRC